MKKICSKCKVPQSIENFTTDNSKTDGLQRSCNKCQSIRARAWYQKNKSKARAQANKSYHINSDKIKERRKKIRVRDKDKISMIKKKYYRENKNRHKEYSWKSNGIKDMTVERYNLLLIKQKYCCAICLTPNTKLKRVLAVDHDHKTGEVRGLLCDACNRALGYFKESQFIINNARTYLLCHKK